jgi:ribosomal protein L30
MITGEMLKKNILITQVRGFSGLTRIHKANLIGLGLSGIGSKSSLLCSESTTGMLRKVEHLVKISVE